MVKSSDYLNLFMYHVDKYVTLKKRRDALNEEMRKVNRLAKAALAMLPDDERVKMAENLRKIEEPPTEGLTEAIRSALVKRYEVGWTPAVKIKEMLDAEHYDFSAYKSNPLISIHSILKRFKREEVTSRQMLDGSMGYRLTHRAYEQRRSRELSQFELDRMNKEVAEMKKIKGEN